MFRIDADAHVANQFSEGDIPTARPGTKVSAEWLNAVQEELCNFITSTGLTLDKASSTQLTSAIAAIRAAANSWSGKQAFDAGLTSGVAPSAASDVVRKAELDAEIAARVAAASPAIQNITAAGGNWSASSSSGQEPRASKDAFGTVHLRGRIVAGASGLSAGSTIATLPSGCWPAAKRYFTVGTFNDIGAWNGGYAVEINPDGTIVTRALVPNVTPYPTGAGYSFDLSGISFVAGW